MSDPDLRQRLLNAAAASFPTVEVELRELQSEPLRVRSLTAGQRAEVMADIKMIQSAGERDVIPKETRERMRGLNARLVAYGVCDADGRRVFQDKDADRIAEEWPNELVERIGDAVLDASGVGGRAHERQGKGSETPATGSSSTSPPTSE